jgi:hypothetical protein
MDRRRYVETWQRFADPALTPVRISLPLLSRRLRERYLIKEAQAVEALRPGAFDAGKTSSALTGEAVDTDEREILRSCHNLSLRELRERSYPAVFYEHVWSALMRESGRDTQPASTVSSQTVGVSYKYEVSDAKTGEFRWRIHFDLPWLLAVSRSIAERAEPHIKSQPLGQPGSWWLRG